MATVYLAHPPSWRETLLRPFVAKVGRVRLPVSSLATGLTLLAAACQQPQEPEDQTPPDTAYTILDLGALRDDPESRAYDINTASQVVGVSSAAGGPFAARSTAFLWRGSVMTALGSLGAGYSEARGINDKGEVVGWNSTISGGAFLWQNDVITPLGGGRWAADINNAGQIVGARDESSGSWEAVLWQAGQMTSLGFGTLSEGKAINATGDIVVTEGQRSFLWRQGAVTVLGTLGGEGSEALGINDAGDVVGRSQVASGDYHAFLWRNGTMTDLGTLGGCCSRADDINNLGQIVGGSVMASGEAHAVLWQDGVMKDLGTLSGVADLPPYSEANGINDAGQIVGASRLAKGVVHAVMWQPPTIKASRAR